MTSYIDRYRVLLSLSSADFINSNIFFQIAYLIAFAFELLWILESSSNLPVAAILLCAGYFTMALFAALLVHGLATVRLIKIG